MTWSPSKLTRLRVILAELYPRELDQRRMAEETELRMSAIAFDASADNSWYSILRQASKENMIEALLARARGEYPNHEALRSATNDLPKTTPVNPPKGNGPMPNGPWHFFLAHAGVDTKEAEVLYDLLAPDFLVFLDKRSLLPGDEWDLELARAQRAAQVTVVLVSDRYDKAYYLREEIAAAIQLARTNPDGHRVVPVFLDGWPADASGVPYGLRIRNAVDARTVGGMPGVAAELRRLAGTLAAAPVSPPPPPAPPAPARHDRTELYDAICRLVEPQYDQLLFYLNVPAATIAPKVAPLATRAVDVVLLMEQQGTRGLDGLAQTIRKVAPGLLP